MGNLKRLERIKKIYELRAQDAERLAAERARARAGLEDKRDAMGRTLQEEVDNCDSIERVPFDFAARYYRASIETIAAQEVEIGKAADLEIDAYAELQKRYIEKKEFEVYYDRKFSARKAEIRAKRDSEAREFAPRASRDAAEDAAGDDGFAVAGAISEVE